MLKKLSVVALLAAALFVGSTANAATADELQAQITALLAQISQLQGGQTSSIGCYAFTRDLTDGVSGADVSALQSYLAAKGMFSVAPTGYFGAITKSAVASWQSANGVMPAVGYFGAISRAKYAATCGAVVVDGDDDTTGDDDDTTMGGGDGDITNINEVSSADSTIVEGETNEVFAFDFDVEGDVEIDRVDFYIESDSAASENADDYFSSAILMVDGEEVAALDVEDFDEDDYDMVTSDSTDEYRLRFSGLGLVYEDGDQPEFVLAFEVNNTIDSLDQASVWTVNLESDSIRFVDGKGFSSEEGASLAENFGTDAEEMAELEAKTSSNDLDATTIEVSDSGDTQEVEVFTFKLEEQNDVDVTINDLTVSATTSIETDGSVVMTDAYLYDGSTLLGSESVPATGVITFEDIDLAIDAGDVVELTVKLTFADVDDYTEGETVQVSFTSIDDAEDANGNDEGDMTISGTPDGATHELRSEGIFAELVDVDIEKSVACDGPCATGTGESAEATFVFDVTAIGADAYLVNGVDEDGTYTAGSGLTTETTYAPAGGSSTGTYSVTGDEAGSTHTHILDGDTVRVTLVINIAKATDPGFVSAVLEGIEWNNTDDTVSPVNYTLDLQDFETADLFLNWTD